MAKYKSKDLLTKTKDELIDRIQFLRKEQFNLRFQAVNGQIENPLRFKLIRREIAAIKKKLVKMRMLVINLKMLNLKMSNLMIKK